MSEKIAFYYRPEANPEGQFIAGVPLRDLSEGEAAALPKHLLAAVRAAPFYEGEPAARKTAQKAKE